MDHPEETAVELIPRPRGDGRAGSSASASTRGPGSRQGGSPGWRALVVGPRVVGPGRIERDLRREVESVQGELRAERESAGRLRAELEMGQREIEIGRRIEHGCQRRLDRLEDRLAEGEQQRNRLLVSLGAMGQENRALRDRLARFEALTARAGSEEPVKRDGTLVRWARRLGLRPAAASRPGARSRRRSSGG